jgi:hypothetical protein
MLFRHGKVGSGMNGWLRSVTEATTGVGVKVEMFSGSVPVCFEEAMVFRRNLVRMSTERLLAMFDFMRCNGRLGAAVCQGPTEQTQWHCASPFFSAGMVDLSRTGSGQAGVPQECVCVAGCKHHHAVQQLDLPWPGCFN